MVVVVVVVLEDVVEVVVFVVVVVVDVVVVVVVVVSFAAPNLRTTNFHYACRALTMCFKGSKGKSICKR